MRTCPRCGETCADWRPTCPACGFTFFSRETRKVAVIDEDHGELQQLVDALEGGRTVQSPAPRPSARTITVTRDVPSRTSVDSRPSRQRGFGWVAIGGAILALVIVGIANFPLQTIAACAVLSLLSGFCYFVVINRR
jgi:RNA polymerase subunit RPABC4/transcription elongation factor Spt4